MTGSDHQRRGRASPIKGLRAPLPLAAALTLAAAIVLGGAPIRSGPGLFIIFALGVATAALAVRQGAMVRWRALPVAARALTVAVAITPLLQLAPLPFDIWRALPGRELDASVLQLVGVDRGARPLSVAPAETAPALLLLFPLAGLFLAGLTVRFEQAMGLVAVVAALILFSFALGVVEAASGGTVRLYDTPHNGFLLGFFSNKNHSALLMAAGILVGNFLIRRNVRQPQLSTFLRVTVVVVGFAAVLATASRFGLVLAVAATVLSLVDLLRSREAGRRRALLAAGAAGLVAAGLALAYSGVASRSVERYGDLSQDRRDVIWRVSAKAAREYFPVGSGIGTFVDVYRTVEPIDALAPTYANHAHNEYLELTIEAGAWGIALIALFLWVWLNRYVRVARANAPSAETSRARALALLGGGLVVLPVLHSVVDYPLRTPALALLFALSLGWLMRPAAIGERGSADGTAFS